MSFYDAVLLGLVQGLTEFLPVSSSGHLVLIQKVIEFQGDALALDSLLHLGTLAAVLVYFRQEILAVGRSLWRRARHGERDEYFGVAGYLAIATVPAAVAGVLFEKLIGDAFESIMLVGLMLVVTGALLWSTEGRSGSRGLDKLKLSDSLWVGVAQMTAIMPGISRSGATIAAGMWRGLAREDAAKFSFLLSIPIIVGASGYSIIAHGQDLSQPAMALAGVIAAAFSGFAAIALLMALIRTQNLRLFSVYCFIVGSIAIAASFFA